MELLLANTSSLGLRGLCQRFELSRTGLGGPSSVTVWSLPTLSRSVFPESFRNHLPVSANVRWLMSLLQTGPNSQIHFPCLLPKLPATSYLAHSRKLWEQTPFQSAGKIQDTEVAEIFVNALCPLSLCGSSVANPTFSFFQKAEYFFL